MARVTGVKIRNPKTLRGVAVVLAYATRFWHHSFSYAYRPLTTYLVNDRPELLGDARYVYVFWHEQLFIPSYVYAQPDTAVLVGLHRDGELLSRLHEHFGLRLIRGSSSRGGTAALLRMLRDPTGGRHFALTPDGPRGPRRKCQLGTVYLASRTGLPIVPCGFGFSRCWRAGSWDRLAVPLPFSRVRGVSSHPIHVPAGLRTDELATYQTQVDEALNHASAVAERWAECRCFDPLGYEPPPGTEVNTKQQKAWASVRRVGRGSP